jgi:hypothetical protein
VVVVGVVVEVVDPLGAHADAVLPGQVPCAEREGGRPAEQTAGAGELRRFAEHDEATVSLGVLLQAGPLGLGEALGRVDEQDGVVLLEGGVVAAGGAEAVGTPAAGARTDIDVVAGFGQRLDYRLEVVAADRGAVLGLDQDLLLALFGVDFDLARLGVGVDVHRVGLEVVGRLPVDVLAVGGGRRPAADRRGEDARSADDDDDHDCEDCEWLDDVSYLHWWSPPRRRPCLRGSPRCSST